MWQELEEYEREGDPSVQHEAKADEDVFVHARRRAFRQRDDHGGEQQERGVDDGDQRDGGAGEEAAGRSVADAMGRICCREQESGKRRGRSVVGLVAECSASKSVCVYIQ